MINLSYNKIPQLIFLICFLSVISFPAIFKICHYDISIKKVNENRKMAKSPKFKKLTVQKLPREWDNYFKDRLGLRNVFLPSYLYLWGKILFSPVDNILHGNNGEFFSHLKTVRANLGCTPYSKKEKMTIRVSAAGKHAFFYSKNIPYYLFLIPDKATLYPEKLPWYARMMTYSGIYHTQKEELEKSHINFYSMQEELAKYSSSIKLYDKYYDTAHWNGDAYSIAYPYMANILAKDNPIYAPASTPEYYEFIKNTIEVPPYGKDQTKSIHFNKLKEIEFKKTPESIHTKEYNLLSENKNKYKGSLLFLADSYTVANHGLFGVSPFIYNVKTSIHTRYQLKNPSHWIRLIDQMIQTYKIDCVIEAFCERTRNEVAESINDPLIRILGDTWLHTDGVTIDNNLPASNISTRNCSLSIQEKELILTTDNSNPVMEFTKIVKTDDLGRIALIMNVTSPADTNAVLRYALPSQDVSSGAARIIPLKKGDNLIHFDLYLEPFKEFKLSLSPGTVPGKYIFKQIPQLEALRERMKKDGI